jgi:hypothetical protein
LKFFYYGFSGSDSLEEFGGSGYNSSLASCSIDEDAYPSEDDMETDVRRKRKIRHSKRSVYRMKKENARRKREKDLKKKLEEDRKRKAAEEKKRSEEASGSEMSVDIDRVDSTKLKAMRDKLEAMSKKVAEMEKSAFADKSAIKECENKNQVMEQELTVVLKERDDMKRRLEECGRIVEAAMKDCLALSEKTLNVIKSRFYS